MIVRIQTHDPEVVDPAEIAAALEDLNLFVAEVIINDGERVWPVKQDQDAWTCPGCGRKVEPSDARRHASECPDYDGSSGY